MKQIQKMTSSTIRTTNNAMKSMRLPKSSSCRNVNGILVLDKPINMTSNAILQKVKKLYAAKKAGHTGSLDPLATGMLPICFGEATKFSQYLLEADKTYLVSALLGVRTTTSDAEGEEVAERAVPNYTISDLDKAFAPFRGEIEQIPSMYSALKYQGQPLYKLARQGITVERKSRQIAIYELSVLAYQNQTVHFQVRCSKGTYIRTLVDDFGEALGCGAHVTQLRRLQVGPYSYEKMLNFSELEKKSQDCDRSLLDHYLLPIDSALSAYPKIEVTTSMAFYLQRGQAVSISQTPRSGLVKIYQPNNDFLGIGEVTTNGKITPRRLIRTTIRD